MRATIIISLIFAALMASCTQSPPEEFLTPEFEEISIDDSDPAAIRFTCRMNSMSQLTVFGLDYTDRPDMEDTGWLRVAGAKTSDITFEVILYGLSPGTTYRYRMFIGNGLEELHSSDNHYTTPN